MRATSLAEAEPAHDLPPELTKLLRNLLKPIEVKSLVITHSDKYTIRGIVLVVCPLEKRESGRGFEIGLEGKLAGSILYVSVDGRRLFPKRSSLRTSRGGSGRR